MKKGIFIDQISGYSDHCHIHLTVDANQKISDEMHLIKCESPNWINNEN